MLSLIDSIGFGALPQAKPGLAAEIDGLIAHVGDKLVSIESLDPSRLIAGYEIDLLELKHRQLLRGLLPQILEYVGRRKWAVRAARIRSSTRHITEKHNELLKGLVTDRYVELFEEALRDMKRPVKVRVQTKGQKGRALKQIVLEGYSSTRASMATPDKVLSEGEKRAVALADFLTEVALDDSSAAVVLDDPVTSLDHEWKEILAERFVVEAKRRQVIIFTHDLVFLYSLLRTADMEQVDSRVHWIKRGDIDDKPGYVYQDNCPALERDYQHPKRARSLHDRACSSPAEEQERLLREGFAALRTSYEAFIIFDLLNEVVMRFDERISFGRLRGIVWDKSIIGKVVERYELLSRHIEGHLHSDAYSPNKPTPKALLSEIEFFETLRRELKQLKSAS